ncbi:hypothetical protein BHE74_00010395, partial [Ensete ventricosum]
VMTRWQHHSIGSQGLHMDCGSSSKCTGVDTMNSTKSVKRQMLRVSSNPRAKKMNPANCVFYAVFNATAAAAAAAGKRRRVPSVYNSFIKTETSINSDMYRMSLCCCSSFAHRDEIRRLKARNPDISHREAFSTAAKNVRMGTLASHSFQAVCRGESTVVAIE